MIYLLTLICSLCINFAYIEPYNMISLNAENEQYIDTIKQYILNNRDGFWNTVPQWTACVNVPNERWIVLKGYYNNSYADKIIVLCPKEDTNQGASSLLCNGYTYDLNNVVDSINLQCSGYFGFHLYDSGVDNDMGVYGYHSYDFNSGNFSILYCATPIYYQSQLVVDVTDVIIGWEGEGIGIGSLGGNGHSSGGSPSDTLNNNGVTWSSPSPTLHSNGHSVGVSSSSAAFDFTNSMQNLLGQLVDNANDIIGNLSGIGSILGGMSNNIIQGASAIFNGISTFNNNVNGFLGYLTEIPSSSDIVDALQSEDNIGALYDLSQQIDIFSEIGLTQVNSAPTYTFNFSGTMFDYVNNVTLDFSFLDSTKSIWQTLLIALLYFNLLVTILVGLPDLIQGRGET